MERKQVIIVIPHAGGKRLQTLISVQISLKSLKESLQSLIKMIEMIDRQSKQISKNI